MEAKAFWEFVKKVKDSVIKEYHSFALWFSKEVKPELLEFLDDNRDLALKIVTDVALDLVDEIGTVKFAEAGTRLGKALLEGSSGLVIPNHWIGLLIEIAVAIMKARAGK